MTNPREATAAVDEPTRAGDNPGRDALFWLIAMALASDAINRTSGVEKLSIDIFDNPGNLVQGVCDFCDKSGLVYVSILPHEMKRADQVEKLLEYFEQIAKETDEQLQAVIDFDEMDKETDAHNEELDKLAQIKFYAWVLRVEAIQKELDTIFGKLESCEDFSTPLGVQVDELLDAVTRNLGDALTAKYKVILDYSKAYAKEHEGLISTAEALDYVLGSDVVTRSLSQEVLPSLGNATSSSTRG